MENEAPEVTQEEKKDTTVKTSIIIDIELLKWAKRQNGGFAVLVRTLLEQARAGTINIGYPLKP